ncbi:hypothetical protein ORV05_01545 [Amycolatopsis cynarae]|uniref:Uncharacterized protein n=1 Tax=Amycolatopsis cynarae TaxID=2995223 RepID=A0ABY7B3L8_9PSEU|nr:hypothetical protein [Amycolatopsis sp. HUAS 11-8]WAL66530.1 hypothetical protein ORV05_01545 [Amycolatopsis sp. HUAS 11-8]
MRVGVSIRAVVSGRDGVSIRVVVSGRDDWALVPSERDAGGVGASPPEVREPDGVLGCAGRESGAVLISGACCGVPAALAGACGAGSGRGED